MIDTRARRLAAGLPVDQLDTGLLVFTLFRLVPGVRGRRDGRLVVDWKHAGDVGQRSGPASSRPGIGDPPPGFGCSTIVPGEHRDAWKRGTMHPGTKDAFEAFVNAGNGPPWQAGYQPGPFDPAVAIVHTSNVWDCIHPGAWTEPVTARDDLGCIVGPVVAEAVRIADNLVAWGSSQRLYSCAIIEVRAGDPALLG